MYDCGAARPTETPQALAWDGKQLWMSSRDLGTFYRTELDRLKIVEEIDPPGVVWAGQEKYEFRRMN